MGRMDNGRLDGGSSALGETEGIGSTKSCVKRDCLCQCIGRFWITECAYE